MIDERDPPSSSDLASRPSRVPPAITDLDDAEKKETEEKLRQGGVAYLMRLLRPVSAEDRRVYAKLWEYLRPYLYKIVIAVLLSAIGGSLTAFQLIYLQQGISALIPEETTASSQDEPVGFISKLKGKFDSFRGAAPPPAIAVDPASDPAPPAIDPAPPEPAAPATDPAATATEPAATATEPATPATQPAVVATDPAAPIEPVPPATRAERMSQLKMVVILFVAIAAIGSLLKYLREVMMASVSRKMIRNLRDDCFRTLVRLPLSFHQAQHSSRMMSRLTKDITRLRQGFISMSLGLVSELFVFLAALGYALYQLGWIAIVLFAFVIVAFIPIRVIGDRLRYRDKQAEAGEADLFAIISEALLGQKVVKAFTAEKHEIKRFRETARSIYRRQMETYRLRATTEPIVDFIAGISLAAGIFVLGGLVLDGELRIDVLFAVMVAMQKVNRSVSHLGKYQNDFIRGMTAGERVVQILDQKPERPETANAKELTVFERAIEYDDVKFSYVRGSRALRGISLTIEKGETIAIVGPSGAGKTSLVDLLPRFYDPNKGAVRIDGVDVREYTLKSLRSMIGIVAQETILFSGTLAENIAYGIPGTTREAIERAAEAACADEFIRGKEHGYDSPLGERGLALSGGERQRIAIARALLKNPPILILDEATSALDAESEAHVQKALENLMHGRTTIVIAHRLSTIRRANRIAVIRAGELVELGSHDELIAAGGLYARAYTMQMEAMLRGEQRSVIDAYFALDPDAE
jgi:subfamily B ATP-binding cassette protein MsbA